MAARAVRKGVVAAALTAAVVLTGCSSGDGEPVDDEIAGSATPSGDTGTAAGGGEEAGGEGSQAQDVAALESLYADYWAALVTMENAEELDPSPLAGIASQELTEQQVSRIRPFKDNGMRRDGEPAVDKVTVTVDGDTARIESCVDEDAWLLLKNGEPADLELLGPAPRVFDAERVEGDWLITDTVPAEEANVTC
ncbi:hypothetical protein [Streptomyces aidingensis]|nr:hypothetical protein [Streptomyces aidingensis]